MIDNAGTILRFDPCTERFEPLACWQAQPRVIGLAAPIALAVHPDGHLLVLDSEARTISLISLLDGNLRHRWGPFAVDGMALAASPIVANIDPLTGAPSPGAALPADVWEPVDLAVLADGRLVVSDFRSGVLQLFDRRGCWIASWSGETPDQPALDRPTALAASEDGLLYVVEEARQAVAVLDRCGTIIARTADASLLPDLVEGASLATDADGTLWISSRKPGPAMLFRCDCAGMALGGEEVRLVPEQCEMLAFASDGTAIMASGMDPCVRRSTSIARQEAGRVAFEPLDSHVTATVWDTLRLEIDLPMGCRVVVSAFASDAALGPTEVEALGPSFWTETEVAVSGPEVSLALRTKPGRYLWLRIALFCNGTDTPTIYGFSVGWPRRSSARYLPAAWQAEPTHADFLERFLAIFDELRLDILAPIETMPALFDPKATPAAEQGAMGEDFLDWLAGWIGLVLERNWPVERRRQLVREAPRLFRIKGTLKGLARHIEIYTGIAPKIVEHFRLRRFLTLDEATLDGQEKLWGPDIVRRLQLDGYAEIGRFALVDGGDPLTDPVAAFAHRATVYVPVTDEFGDADRAALEEVIAAAKPAHVVVDIRLMRPRFVIGCDLLLGVNTVIGTDTRLAQTDVSQLGEDIRLAGPPSAFTLSPGLRLGPDTTLP
ncbi:phage tail protein [Alteraurantiacibacter aquimixticola]|nr:phage tail protein [Alteraurantiacibacter aquimixticola]